MSLLVDSAAAMIDWRNMTPLLGLAKLSENVTNAVSFYAINYTYHTSNSH